MVVFRVTDRRFPIFDGTGALLVGGRWSCRDDLLSMRLKLLPELFSDIGSFQSRSSAEDTCGD